MNIPNDLFYARSHEWARAQGDAVVTAGPFDEITIDIPDPEDEP